MTRHKPRHKLSLFMSVLPSSALPLGKVSPVPQQYDPSLLYPVPRAVGRESFLSPSLNGKVVPFVGCDRWDCFEVSWLNANGIPYSAFANIQYPANSPNIVESKSLKLYLTGFHETRYPSSTALAKIVVADLSKVLETDEVSCEISPFSQMALPTSYEQLGECIDTAVEGEIGPLTVADPASLLKSTTTQVEEQLYSQILRSLCPVTSQPDWGTVVVRYCGNQIDRAALFRYVAAYRNHQGFHEACCEQIFTDILRMCAPDELAVGCYFARRGGISITPIRYSGSVSFCSALLSIRLDRQ